MATGRQGDGPKRLRGELVGLLAEHFGRDTDGMYRLATRVDPRIVPHIPWNTSMFTLIEAVCDYFTRTLGEWDMVYRLTATLFELYPGNPAVAEMYRQLCASSYPSPRSVAHPGRARAVQDFIARHFSEYEQIRRFDERGTSTKQAEQTQFQVERYAEASQYFATLGEGLQRASRHTLKSDRLDVYAHILEGATDYRACHGLMQQIRLALATEGFLSQHGQTLAEALRRLRSCIVEFLAAGLWPPIAARVYREYLDALPTAQSLTGDDRRALDDFTECLRVLRLLEGSRIDEHEVLAEIDRTLPGCTGALHALLQYRRCLAAVYCGDWDMVRGTLERPPAGWEPTWSGFLWAELGEFVRSVAAYVQASQASNTDHVRASALRSRLMLVNISHPRHVPVPPGLKFEEIYAILSAGQKSLDAQRTRVRSDLDHELTEARRHISAAQTLYDSTVLLRLAADCLRSAANTRRVAEQQASGRGSFNGDPTTLLSTAYHGMWLCGVPTLGLRDEAAGALIDAALLACPLDGVLEVVFVTRAITTWPEASVERSVRRFVARSGIPAWRTLLAEQLELLARCARELERQGYFHPGDRAPERTQHHPISVRLTAIVTLFARLCERLPDDVLARVGEQCTAVLRSIGAQTRRYDDLTAACFELVIAGCVRLARAPGDIGLDVETLTYSLFARGRLDEERCRDLSPLWTHMNEQYRQDLVTGVVRGLETQTVQGQDEQAEETTPLAARVEWLLSGPDESSDLPLEQSMAAVAQHYSDWRNYGTRGPFLDLRAPASSTDVETTWAAWRTEALRALAERRLTSATPLTRRWLASGVQGLAYLALRIADTSLWVRLFERTRPWPIVSGAPFDLAGLRRAIEDGDADGDLRRRFYRRVVSADTGEDTEAIVEVFAGSLATGDTVVLEDVEALRLLWERNSASTEVAERLLESLAVVLERTAGWTAAACGPLWVRISAIVNTRIGHRERRRPGAKRRSAVALEGALMGVQVWEGPPSGLRRDGPFSTRRWQLDRRRSQMASAVVGSPI